MMDMPMKSDGMKDKKANYFKCPKCNAELCATSMEKKEDKGMNENAGNMPFGKLREKITPPEMNSY